MDVNSNFPRVFCLRKPEKKPEKEPDKTRRKAGESPKIKGFGERKPVKKREKGQEKKQEKPPFNLLIPVISFTVYVFLKILISDKK